MKNLRTVLFIVLVVAYIATRLWHLADSCLWFDEIYSVHAAEHSWSDLFGFVALDLIHPPLFYVLLKLWIAIGGESLVWLTLLPVMVAVASLAPFHLVSGELKQDNTAWTEPLALLLLTVNGPWLKYSQEVRMYSLLMFLSLTSLWLFLRYVNRDKGFWWLVAVNILLVWTHYFGWFVIASEVVAVLIYDRAKWRRIVLMTGVTAAAFAPWAIAVLGVATSAELGQNIGWMSRPGLGDVGVFLLNLVEPFYYPVSNADPASRYRVSVPLLLMVLAAVVICVAYRSKRTADERRSIGVLSVFIGLPVLGAFVLSWLLPYSIWGTRHLIVVFAPALFLFATAIADVLPKWVRNVTICMLLMFAGYAGVLWANRPSQNYSWCAWADLAKTAKDDGAEKLYVLEDLVAYHSWFAVRRETHPSIVKLTGIDGMAEDKAYFLPRGFDQVTVRSIDPVSESRLWVAFRARQLDERAPPLRDLLFKGYRVVQEKSVHALGEDAYLVKLER